MTEGLYSSLRIEILMQKIKIETKEKADLFTRLTTYLTVALGLLTGFIVLVSYYFFSSAAFCSLASPLLPLGSLGFGSIDFITSSFSYA